MQNGVPQRVQTCLQVRRYNCRISQLLQEFRNFAEYLFTYYFRAPTYGAPAHHGEECTKVTCGFNNKYQRQNLQDDHHRDYYDHEGSRGGL